jgi:hypothetical protein
VLREYHITSVVGDQDAGQTFVADFARHGIKYQVSERTKSQLYEAFEPHVNGHRVALLDAAQIEQQLLGLVWRGAKIDHQGGEHDDWSNAAVGGACGPGDAIPIPVRAGVGTVPRQAVTAFARVVRPGRNSADVWCPKGCCGVHDRCTQHGKIEARPRPR